MKYLQIDYDGELYYIDDDGELYYIINIVNNHLNIIIFLHIIVHLDLFFFFLVFLGFFGSNMFAPMLISVQTFLKINKSL